MGSQVTDIAVREHHDVVRAEDFLPLMTVQQAVTRKSQINQFIGQVLNEDTDYGKMPGGQQKKVLLKPGAEKLCSIFGLSPRYVKEVVVEDWTGKDHDGEPLFSYEYRCQLYRGDRFMGEAIGSCNSWESKYRYRWVNEDVASLREDFHQLPKRGGRISEPKFAVEKAQTSGQYGKPAAYWQQFKDAIEAGTATEVERPKKTGGVMQCWEIDSTLYRIANPDVADAVNTCQKMAQKRALVAAVLVVTNCSDAFTQDVEDFATDEHGAPQAEPNHKKQAPAKDRPVPKELAKVFENLDKDVSTAVDAYARIEGLFVKKAGDAGLAEYNRVADLFSAAYPNGTSDKAAHKAFLLDLWTALQHVEPEAQVADVAMEAK